MVNSQYDFEWIAVLTKNLDVGKTSKGGSMKTDRTTAQFLLQSSKMEQHLLQGRKYFRANSAEQN
jgi:hypothetical protein